MRLYLNKLMDQIWSWVVLGFFIWTGSECCQTCGPMSFKIFKQKMKLRDLEGSKKRGADNKTSTVQSLGLNFAKVAGKG